MHLNSKYPWSARVVHFVEIHGALYAWHVHSAVCVCVLDFDHMHIFKINSR